MKANAQSVSDQWIPHGTYYNLGEPKRRRLEVDRGDGWYEGETNEAGEAHGEGVYKSDYGTKYSGMFYNNMATGYCKYT